MYLKEIRKGVVEPMNEFTFSYPTKVYYGEKAAEKNLPRKLEKVGKTVILALGGGSIKKNGGLQSESIND